VDLVLFFLVSQWGINVLQRFSEFTRLVEGQAPECNYDISGYQYIKGYYLADNTYPARMDVMCEDNP
jgi:hypothetical protein